MAALEAMKQTDCLDFTTKTLTELEESNHCYQMGMQEGSLRLWHKKASYY
jgi:hypothetical protein